MRKALRIAPLVNIALVLIAFSNGGCYLPKGEVTEVTRVVPGRRLNSRIQRVGAPVLDGKVNWDTPGKLIIRLVQQRRGKVDQEYLAQNVMVMREQRLYYRETFKEGPILTALWYLMEAIGSIGSYGIWDVYTITRLAWNEDSKDEAFGLVGGQVEYATKFIGSRIHRNRATRKIKQGENYYKSPKKGRYGIYRSRIGRTTASVTPNQDIDEIVSLANATIRLEPVHRQRPVFVTKTDRTGKAVFHLSDNLKKLRELAPGKYRIVFVENDELYCLKKVDISLSHIAVLLQAAREAMQPEDQDAKDDEVEDED